MLRPCPTCGIENAHHARVLAGCFGAGIVDCLCGGDGCVCHNHGLVDCEGCVDCEPTVVMDNDLFCHADHSHAAASPPSPPSGGKGTSSSRSGARLRSRQNSHT